MDLSEIVKMHALKELNLQHLVQLQHKYSYAAYYADASKLMCPPPEQHKGIEPEGAHSTAVVVQHKAQRKRNCDSLFLHAH